MTNVIILRGFMRWRVECYTCGRSHRFWTFMRAQAWATLHRNPSYHYAIDGGK